MKSGNEVVFQTDKSSSFYIDTTENYKKACEPHFQSDEEIMMEEKDRVEKSLSYSRAGEQEKGPPVKPVCGAKAAASGQLSSLLWIQSGKLLRIQLAV